MSLELARRVTDTRSGSLVIAPGAGGERAPGGRRRRLPIRRKLVGMIAGAAAGALLLGFGIVVAQDVSGFRRAAAEQASLVAQLVGESTVSDLEFDDREAARQRLERLAAVPGIEAARLYDERGALFAAWSRLPGPPAETALEPALLRDGVAFRAGTLLVAEPIHHRGVPRGALVLEAATAPLRGRLQTRLVTLLLLLVGIVGIAVLAAARLQRLVSEPILDLARATRRIRFTGDYSLRVRKAADDEIGLLCDRFNELLEQLQLHEAQRDEAEQRTQEKSRFLANMSHELRTPLNSIIGFSEVLIGRLEGRVDAREGKFLRNIHTSGRHLLDVINDLLDLAKVEAGRMEIRPEVLAVRPLLEGMVTLMRGVADARRVHLETTLEADLPPLHADSVKAKQILYNLMSNAVKFSPEEGTVRLEARHARLGADPAVELAVIDHGVGIAPRDQERIFEAFWQAEAVPGRHLAGTGLGLALVKTFVDLHGGTVAVESALGRGSVFRVVLPAAPAGPGASLAASGDLLSSAAPLGEAARA